MVNLAEMAAPVWTILFIHPAYFAGILLQEEPQGFCDVLQPDIDHGGAGDAACRLFQP